MTQVGISYNHLMQETVNFRPESFSIKVEADAIETVEPIHGYFSMFFSVSFRATSGVAPPFVAISKAAPIEVQNLRICGNAWNLTQERQAQRKDLCRQYTQLGRAMSLRETLQSIYANSDRRLAEAELRVVVWLGSAQPPPLLPPFGPDRSSVSGRHPRLLRHQTDLRSDRGRQRYHPARKNEWLGDLETLSTSEPRASISSLEARPPVPSPQKGPPLSV
jgi:hypothetical protein